MACANQRSRASMADTSTTTIIASHDIEDGVFLSDAIYILDRLPSAYKTRYGLTYRARRPVLTHVSPIYQLESSKM